MDRSLLRRWLDIVCENWTLLVVFAGVNLILLLLTLLTLLFAERGTSSHFIVWVNLVILVALIGSATGLLALCTRR